MEKHLFKKIYQILARIATVCGMWTTTFSLNSPNQPRVMETICQVLYSGKAWPTWRLPFPQLPVWGYSFTLGEASCLCFSLPPTLFCRSSIPSRQAEKILAPFLHLVPTCRVDVIPSCRRPRILGLQLPPGSWSSLGGWRFHMGRATEKTRDCYLLPQVSPEWDGTWGKVVSSPALEQ